MIFELIVIDDFSHHNLPLTTQVGINYKNQQLEFVYRLGKPRGDSTIKYLIFGTKTNLLRSSRPNAVTNQINFQSTTHEIENTIKIESTRQFPIISFFFPELRYMFATVVSII